MKELNSQVDVLIRDYFYRYFKGLWPSQDNSAEGSKRNKKDRIQTKDREERTGQE